MIELEDALSRVGRANDMLPPRQDDKVAGRIAARFVEGLSARISAGTYANSTAVFVPVPKRKLTTRPAAVLSLMDRVVFEALIQRSLSKISKHLVSDDSLIWPRADETQPAWDKFEREPLACGGGYVVSADVAGFYESVDHSELEIAMADAGVSAETRTAIVGFLSITMAGKRGLPQGIKSSDALATLYLTPVDRALKQAGHRFWRHGDDFRIWSPTYASALAVVFDLEQALRKRGLLLSTGKLVINKHASYSKALDDVDTASSAFRERMRAAREQALIEASEEELIEAAEKAGLDEDMQWRFFYHRSIELDEFLKALAPSLMPGPIEIVIEMFNDLMRTKTDSIPLKLRHARLSYCIRRLARAKSPAAIRWVGELLVKQPDEVQDLANYMLAILGIEPQKVVDACQYALTNKTHLLDWERAWIYRVLSRRADLVHRSILDTAEAIAKSDSSNWISRVEAARLLAKSGRLQQQIATQLAANAPECFRNDLTGIVAELELSEPWAVSFLDGARQDPLDAVVIDEVRAKLKQRAAG